MLAGERSMLLRSLSPVLAVVAVSSVVGCAATSGEDAGSASADQTSTCWRSTEIGRRPNRDVGENEQVGLAIDPSGHRHAVYQSEDGRTHYVDLTTHEDVAIAANTTSHARIA